MNDNMKQVFYTDMQDVKQSQPVGLDAIRLYKDSNEAIYAELLMTSHAEKTVIAIIVQLIGSDITGKQIDSIEHQYLDLLLTEGCSVGEDRLIAMNDNRVRRMKAVISTVVYEDGAIWTFGEQEQPDNRKDNTAAMNDRERNGTDTTVIASNIEEKAAAEDKCQEHSADTYKNEEKAENPNKEKESNAEINRSRENIVTAENQGNKGANSSKNGGRIKVPLIIVFSVLLALALALGVIWYFGQNTAKVGDIVTFGHYPQTGTGMDRTPIEWKVLAVNRQKALLISRYALDCKPFDANEGNVTWDSSMLRSWLNDEFLNDAFTSEEQAAIETSIMDNGVLQDSQGWNMNGGSNTWDKVFLLNDWEASKYFKDHEDRRCAPTDYAIQNAAWTNEAYKADGRPTCCWWLRSQGGAPFSAALVDDTGGLGNCGLVDNVNIAVRPAIWVNIASGV